jgi:hypothetical protein
MHLENFRHKGLRQLYADDNPKGVQPATADKLRKLLFAIETAERLEELEKFPGWTRVKVTTGWILANGCSRGQSNLRADVIDIASRKQLSPSIGFAAIEVGHVHVYLPTGEYVVNLLVVITTYRCISIQVEWLVILA